jgi:hypothetical protein
MQNLSKQITQRLNFTEKSIPVALLIICFISFGLLMPALGYYMDDWPYVFFAKIKGLGSLNELQYYDSRPNAAWLFILGFKLLGFRPIAWHIANLILRWLTATLVWLLIKTVWPSRKKEAIYVSLLFAIYPFFMLQHFAIAYIPHWFGFAAFTLSLLLMVKAQTTPNAASKILFAILALVLEATHVFTSEYFSGLELIRLPLLWILLSRTEKPFFKRVSKTLITWLPYMLVLIAYTYWRVAIFQNPPGITRNSPVILLQLFNQPIQAIKYLLTTFSRDTFTVLTIGWQQSLDVDLINFTSAYSLFRIAVSLLSLFFAYFYLSNLQINNNAPDDDWNWGSSLLIIVALATAGLPAWLTGNSIAGSKNILSASRLGLSTMLGASISIWLIVNFFVSDTRKKILFLSILLSLSVNFHINNTYQFKISWEKQERLAQQLIWRAPQIMPGTAVVTDEEVLGVMGDYATSFLINTTYQPKDVKNSPPYWYFPFYYTYPNINKLLQGIPMEGTKNSMYFLGNSKQMLLLSYNPELDRCLWILQPQDINLRLVSEDMRELSQGSNINLIQRVEGTQPTLPAAIYGKQSEHGWCYYFQKADLARQYQQWDEITRFWNAAKTAGERAGNGFEYIPFIEGLAHTGNWSEVKELTHLAKRISKGLEPSLCTMLDRIKTDVPVSLERDNTVSELKHEIKCDNYQ